MIKKLSQASVSCVICLALLLAHVSSPLVSAIVERPIDSGYSHQTAYLTSNQDLDNLQDLLRRTLKANEKSFIGQVGSIKGLGAGASYPQIWLRDSATIIPLSKFYYPLEYLTSWIEEHLACQREDGQFYDWIAPGRATNFRSAAPKVKEVYRSRKIMTDGKSVIISADKNTTEADQETSAVDAAYQVYKISGSTKWLKKIIKGKTILRRLDLSLQYLLRNRFDKKHGLITNAFTADWGDVSPIYPDQRAIYLDNKTPLVAALYTNVLFYRAAEQLTEIHLSAANKTRSRYWQAKALTIRKNINEHLWQEARGYYRMHIVLTPNLARGWPDDSNIFAMGSNGLAALYGISDDVKTRKIFEAADVHRQQFGFSTVAGALAPPYPKGFFKHPAVSEEYVYQNGGQWDWFAGRFLLAEFERGYSQKAYRQLLEIAGKATDNKGLYEWHTKDGQGKGSVNYAGSAGALGSAIFQGLYGIYLDGTVSNLRVRLAEQSAKIHVYQPATDHYVFYDYRRDAVNELIKLAYSSNFPKAGTIDILLPENMHVETLKLDGKKKHYRYIRIGEDKYLSFETDYHRHQLELKLAR